MEVPEMAIYLETQASLLRGGSDLVGLAMLSTRARSATLRCAYGRPAESTDSKALADMRAVLIAAADGAQYFDSLGATGTAPAGTLAAPIDTTIDIVATRDSGEFAGNLTHRLRGLAAALDAAATNREEALTLAVFFRKLGQAALEQASAAGESTLAY